MRINAAGLAIIKKYEKCSLTVYADPRGIATQGWGHVQGVTMNSPPITQDRADRWLLQDLAVAEDAVQRLVDILLNDNQFSALVCLCFNIGQGNFARSSLLKYLNNGWLDPSKDPNAPDAFLDWIYSGGKQLDGLKARRRDERALFVTPTIVSNQGVTV